MAWALLLSRVGDLPTYPYDLAACLCGPDELVSRILFLSRSEDLINNLYFLLSHTDDLQSDPYGICAIAISYAWLSDPSVMHNNSIPMSYGWVDKSSVWHDIDIISYRRVIQLSVWDNTYLNDVSWHPCRDTIFTGTVRKPWIRFKI